MNLETASELCLDTAIQRQRNGAPLDLTKILKHAAGELMEAQEAEAFMKSASSNEELKAMKEEFGLEIADVIICMLIAGKLYGIDMEKTVCYKMSVNEQRAKGKGDKL